MYKYNYTHEKIGFNSVMESWINIRKSNNAIHHINRVHKKKIVSSYPWIQKGI